MLVDFSVSLTQNLISRWMCYMKFTIAVQQNPLSRTTHPTPLKRILSSVRYWGMTRTLTSKNLSGMAVTWLSFRESFSTEVKNLGWSPLVAERGVRLLRLLDERSRETSRSVSWASLSLLESSVNHSQVLLNMSLSFSLHIKNEFTLIYIIIINTLKMLKDNAFINPYILKNIKIITNLQILEKLKLWSLIKITIS